MTKTSTAPMITPGYPSPEYTVGAAWADIWAELTRAKRRKDPYVDGHALAQEFAPKHNLAPATMIAVVSRAASAGLLAKDMRTVAGNRGNRKRTFYAIPVATDD